MTLDTDAITNVLLVDDDLVSLMLLERALRPLSVRLHSVKNGAEALSLFAAHEFSAVILDIEMPGMSGYEVARQIADSGARRHTPIIFVTANRRTDADILRGYDSGAIDFIFKPVDPIVLRSKVRIFHELKLKDRTIREQLRRIEEKNALLERRLQEIKALRGLLPICSSCKRIRNDDGYWEQLETYLHTYTDATFSHGICPECAEKLYPDIMHDIDGQEAGGSGEEHTAP